MEEKVGAHASGFTKRALYWEKKASYYTGIARTMCFIMFLCVPIIRGIEHIEVTIRT